MTFGDKVRELMAAQGVSGLRALAARVPVDPGHLSRVLNGTKPASLELARRLDDELSADGALVALVDARLAQADRTPRRVDTAALDSVASLLASTRRLEDVTSAATVLPTVREYLAMVGRFAEEARAAVRPTAVGLTSELTQYAGWLHVPMRRWSAAERLLDRATVLGMEAGDPQRTTTALSFAAYTAMRQGNIRRAAALSEAARRDTNLHPGWRTYVTYQAAEILAGDDKPAAYRLLAEAEAMVDRIDPAALTEHTYWYVPAFFRGTHAFVLDKLGERERARELMAQSLEELPAEWRSSQWAERRRRFLGV
ncbi:helix-turn-helix transcriptional regulator [Actinophytocola sp.]|uniref:helix-turn-helix domain-containing protein n=1 Tax=Actinophytocola sp. TaxID=1872138 RepID=UPI002ED01CE6